MFRTRFASLTLVGFLALAVWSALDLTGGSTAKAQADDDAALAAADSPAPAPASGGGPAALPPGHPALPSSPNQLPPGHPPMPQGSNLPAGHPPVGAEVPATQPVKGSLIVRAVQGTKGGPSAAGDEVLVEFYTRTGVADKVRTKCDDKGMAMIDDLKIAVTMQPLVTVYHAGITYQTVGKPMTPADPDQVVRAMVFETTDQAPAWDISMRHLMIQPTREGLQVMEVLEVNNPADRTWLGVAAAKALGTPAGPTTAPAVGVTLTLQLPTNAADVTLGRGWDTDLVKIEGSRVVCSMPFLPGAHDFGLTYVIPAKDGQATLDIAAPATVKKMMVMVSDDGTKVAATGLQGGKTMSAGSQSVRMYQGENFAPDQKTSLTVSGLGALPAAGKTAPGPMGQGPEAPSSGPRGAVIVAGAGGAAILVATAFVLAKAPKKKEGLGK